MDDKASSLKKTARLAGLFYILMSVQAPLALMYVPSHIFVEGNPFATCNNILSHEFLFRLSIISQLTSILIFVLLSLTLYRLFKQVNPFQAKLLVVFVVVQVPITFLLETLNFTSLMIAKGEILQTISTEQKQDWVMLLLNIHSLGLSTSEIFWGLWLIPFGLLIYESRFIPRIFAWCLFIGAIGWLSDSVTFLLFPTYNSFISQLVMISGMIGEFPIMLWLLIKGVKNNISDVTSSWQNKNG